MRHGPDTQPIILDGQRAACGYRGVCLHKTCIWQGREWFIDHRLGSQARATAQANAFADAEFHASQANHPSAAKQPAPKRSSYGPLGSLRFENDK